MIDFLYPLLLIFFICYAVLEKTNILGKGKQQLNAGVSLIVSLIFVGAILPKELSVNLIQYMGVLMIVFFVGLLLWGAMSGNGEKGFAVKDKDGFKVNKLFLFLIFGGILLIVLWVTGVGFSLVDSLNRFFSFAFGVGTSGFWSNALTILIIFVVICVAIGWNPFSGSKFSWWIRLKDK